MFSLHTGLNVKFMKVFFKIMKICSTTIHVSVVKEQNQVLSVYQPACYQHSTDIVPRPGGPWGEIGASGRYRM